MALTVIYTLVWAGVMLNTLGWVYYYTLPLRDSSIPTLNKGQVNKVVAALDKRTPVASSSASVDTFTFGKAEPFQ